MPRFEARTKIIEELKELHLHRGSSSHKMALPVCSRTKDIVEPRFPVLIHLDQFIFGTSYPCYTI